MTLEELAAIAAGIALAGAVVGALAVRGSLRIESRWLGNGSVETGDAAEDE